MAAAATKSAGATQGEKRRRSENAGKRWEEEQQGGQENDGDQASVRAIVQFKTSHGEETGPQIEVPLDITTEQLHSLINSILGNEEKLPYSFFLQEHEILENLQGTVNAAKISTETVVPIVYQPQAVFRVRSVTRCSASLPGHTEAVLHVSFSPDGKYLASGSGDTTVRIWDPRTSTPLHTCNGHTNWVLAVAWSPNGRLLASGGMDASVRLWDPETGKRHGRILKGHTKWITALAWEPMHRNHKCTRLASASKDSTIKLWDIVRGQCLFTIGGHTAAVKALIWGGEGLIYSGSQDRTVNVWEDQRGKLVRSLQGHGHWVNCLSASTGYALRTGLYDHTGQAPESEEQAIQRCADRYNAAKEATKRELLVSASDDFTLFLWDPTQSKHPIARMTGHQQPVNWVSFSPDGRLVASASFDGSVRLWNGLTGNFVATFRGHVQAVYQVCWSADSRLLVSSSKDSTLKCWDVRTRKLYVDLPGHADEVFAVDWSPDGEKVASGGKDHVIKMWMH